MNKLKWGGAKIEVLALLPDIKLRLSQGHTRMHVYETYRLNKQLSCGYPIFCRWLKRLSEQSGDNIKAKKKPVSTVKQPPSLTSQIPSQFRRNQKGQSGPVVAKTLMPEFEN